MSRAGWVNGTALAAAVALSVAGAIDRRGPRARDAATHEIVRVAPHVPLPGGGEGIPDAHGHVVPLRDYRRVVSGSLITDRLLVELCDADRILAFSGAGARSSPSAFQYAGKATAEGLGPLEALIALKPDLILMNSFGASPRADKLRGAGIEVFDLGELRGVSTLLPMAEVLSDLLGHPERGRRYAATIKRRLEHVAAGMGDTARRKAIYLVAIANQLYGGTRGTSYHDVITYAGLVDVAAAQFADWPHYTAEQVVALDPEVLVTKEGMSAAICAYPGLDRLSACKNPEHILELPAPLLDEPGPTMLDAAELLFSKAYPRRNR